MTNLFFTRGMLDDTAHVVHNAEPIMSW